MITQRQLDIIHLKAQMSHDMIMSRFYEQFERDYGEEEGYMEPGRSGTAETTREEDVRGMGIRQPLER